MLVFLQTRVQYCDRLRKKAVPEYIAKIYPQINNIKTLTAN